MKVNDRLVWIEVETSGPDPERDRIERVTAILTNKELERLAEVPPTDVEDVAEVEQAVLAMLKPHVGQGAGLLAGGRVQEIRLFLAAHMPKLFEYLHYRNVDVSTVRELVRRWYPDAYASRPEGKAIEGAIAEVKHYRAHAFADVDTVRARAKASEGDADKPTGDSADKP